MQPTYDIDLKKTYKIPSHDCYACDKDAIGVTLHNGRIVAGCERHANPSAKAQFGCMFCTEFVRAGGLQFSEKPYDIAHAKCYAADQKRNS